MQNQSPVPATVTGVSVTYSIPKAWLPGGALGWHGLRPHEDGGGAPPHNGFNFSTTITDTPTHVTVTLLFAVPIVQWGMFSPEYRVEIAADADVVGQPFLVTTYGVVGSEQWITPWTATIGG